MSTRRLTLGVMLALALLLTLSIAFGGIASAQTTGSAGPPSGDGVQPVWYNGNPQAPGPEGGNTNCAYFNPNWYELRVPSAVNGTYTEDGLSVTVNFYNETLGGISGQLMDWSSNIGVDAVFVKAANEGNLYTYSPEDTADTMLHGPINPINGQFYGVSHVSFCVDYELVVSKTADGLYDKRHTWDITKSVNPLSQSGVPGDVLPWTWTVNVSETSAEENFRVSGTISIYNPAPTAAYFTVADVLSDGTNADVICNQLAFTVAAGGTRRCNYWASPPDRSATSNTATVTSSTAGVGGGTATEPINWSLEQVFNGTATVTDPTTGLNESVAAGSSYTYNRTGSHTCSTDRADYEADGSYSGSLTNTATVLGSDGQSDSANSTTAWTCDASFVDVIKTTNGVVDPSKDIRFRLYDADNNDLDDEVSTFGDDDGQLQFATALVPGDTYQICESPVPAAYTFEVRDEDGNVVTTTSAGPPGTQNPTGEVQCFSFVAGDTGVTRVFSINNSFPGGAPRTPGYWKNWNTCTTGNQAATAERLGGVAEGVYLLDDLLPQTIGSFTVETCEVGVLVLEARTVDTGDQKSSDAAYELARNLLAARLNQDAGACEPDGLTWAYQGNTLTFEQVLGAADTLLTSQGFNGTGDYLGPRVPKALKPVRADALYLAGIIDDYNNSEFCTGEPSH